MVLYSKQENTSARSYLLREAEEEEEEKKTRKTRKGKSNSTSFRFLSCSSCGKLKKDTFCVEISHLLLSSVILIFGGALHSVASLGDPMNCLKVSVSIISVSFSFSDLYCWSFRIFFLELFCMLFSLKFACNFFMFLLIILKNTFRDAVFPILN